VRADKPIIERRVCSDEKKNVARSSQSLNLNLSNMSILLSLSMKNACQRHASLFSSPVGPLDYERCRWVTSINTHRFSSCKTPVRLKNLNRTTKTTKTLTLTPHQWSTHATNVSRGHSFLLFGRKRRIPRSLDTSADTRRSSWFVSSAFSRWWIDWLHQYAYTTVFFSSTFIINIYRSSHLDDANWQSASFYFAFRNAISYSVIPVRHRPR
jgi:hypothetical protein